MSKYIITDYQPSYYSRWNQFVEDSNNGTLFHRLDFLDYHQHKFEDVVNHLMWLKGEAVFAVMPMTIIQQENSGKKIARSPFGASFGGIALHKQASLKQTDEVVKLLIDYYQENGISEAHITMAPTVYAHSMQESLHYCLLANGFEIEKMDLFHITALPEDKQDIQSVFQGRARTSLKKIGSDFDLIDNADVKTFYGILSQDKKRHQSEATHTRDELQWLVDKFGDRIWIDISVHKETKAKAGICYFRTHQNCLLTFYIAQEDQALGQNGPTYLIDRGMEKAVQKGVRYFDFGSSTYGYHIENIGVSGFKESFGANGFARTSYVLNLQ